MPGGLSIPGVSDKYKTNDLVKVLIEEARLPLTKEEEKLEEYKSQQNAWRDVNQKMSTLRDTVKSLYSFENPFSNKLASSSDEDCITVTAGREASFDTFKLDVVKTASCDRFLSSKIDSNKKVKEGLYTFQVGEKTIEMNWKGGKLSDFVSAINRRGNDTIKASLINISPNEKNLIIESLKTGKENKLIFKNEALNFAKEIEMISPAKSEANTMQITIDKIKNPENTTNSNSTGLPNLSSKSIKIEKNQIIIPPRGGFEIDIPRSQDENAQEKFEFDFYDSKVQDITVKLNESFSEPQISSSGEIFFKGITVTNNLSETTLPKKIETPKEPVNPVEIPNQDIFYIKNKDGTEEKLSSTYFTKDEETGKTKVSFSLEDFPNAKSLVVKNSNTGKEISLSNPQIYDVSKSLGFVPNNPISQADDAKIKYQGITISRPSNDIDDVIPHITLHLHDKTEKAATIKIEPDTESAKDAIITFVGKYNQALAEMTILSTDKSKPEVVAELDYLTDDEKESYYEKLGMFQGEFVLTNGKSSLQRICASPYKYMEDSKINLLSDIGISTNVSKGNSGYNAGKLRGYLEIDEKKLDEALSNNLITIKNLFGYDSDNDLIIDTGVAFKLDQQLTSWVRSGGVISNKTNILESNIKNTNKQITRLQTQIENKEAEIRRKYSNMEGSLNSLENQQNTLHNFSNQNNKN